MFAFFCLFFFISIGNCQTYDDNEQAKVLNALYYAYGSYCSVWQLSSWNCKWCQLDDAIRQFEINPTGVIEGDSLQAYTGYDHANTRIVIAFRGTHNIPDWMDNIDIILTTYEHIPSNITKSMKLHEGFIKAFKSLEKLGLKAAIKDMLTKYPNSDILVTGHSLGGALAAVSALELKQNPVYNEYAIKSVNVITFGEPRWCNKNLALFFDDIIDSDWRIVNGRDIVPTIPYKSLGYYHTSTMIWYTSTDPLTYRQCDGSGEDFSCSHVGYSIDDHLNYLGLYEDCPIDGDSVGNNTTNMMEMSSTMMADMESTDTPSVDLSIAARSPDFKHIHAKKKSFPAGQQKDYVSYSEAKAHKAHSADIEDVALPLDYYYYIAVAVVACLFFGIGICLGLAIKKHPKQVQYPQL